MSWTSDLVKLYDIMTNMESSNQDYNPSIIDGKKLLPLYHWKYTPNIVVTLDRNGEFIGARLFGEDEPPMYAPASRDYLNRSGNGAKNMPGPVHDQLNYVAGDWLELTGKEPGNFDKYYNTLKNLSESSKCCIYEQTKKYVERRCLLHDLIKCGILDIENGKIKLGESGRNSKAAKGKDPGKLNVYFQIQNETEDELKEAIEAWINYADQHENIEGEMEISYLSGQLQHVMDKALPVGPMGKGRAKLISSNDPGKFKGNFSKASEAMCLGRDDVWKLAQTVNWLLNMHSVSLDTDESLMLWLDSGANPITDEAAQYSAGWNSDGEEELRTKLLRVGEGEFVNTDCSYMILRRLSDGCVSVQSYECIRFGELAENIDRWIEETSWPSPTKEKTIRSYGAANLVNILFGVEDTSGLLKVLDSKERSRQVKKLLPVILSGQRMPFGIYDQAVRAASSPQNYKSIYLWRTVVGAACGVIRKYLSDTRKGSYSMILERENTSRSYLFGRYLGMMHYIETSASDGQGANTNAMRLMTAFKSNPSAVADRLYASVQPYLRRIGKKNYRYENRIRKELNEIMAQINTEKYRLKKPLSGEFILGMEHQIHYMYESKEDKSAQKTSESNPDENGGQTE